MGWLRERERELAAIDALVERGGGVLLVEGRAGIGKTSLVEAACSRADALGQEVLRARGSFFRFSFVSGPTDRAVSALHGRQSCARVLSSRSRAWQSWKPWGPARFKPRG